MTVSFKENSILMDEQDGFSGLFYIMLILGIVGALGFFVVALGAGGA